MAQNRQKKRGYKGLAGYYICGRFEWISDGVCVRGEIWKRDDKSGSAFGLGSDADKAKFMEGTGNS